MQLKVIIKNTNPVSKGHVQAAGGPIEVPALTSKLYLRPPSLRLSGFERHI